MALGTVLRHFSLRADVDEPQPGDAVLSHLAVCKDQANSGRKVLLIYEMLLWCFLAITLAEKRKKNG